MSSKGELPCCRQRAVFSQLGSAHRKIRGGWSCLLPPPPLVQGSQRSIALSFLRRIAHLNICPRARSEPHRPKHASVSSSRLSGCSICVVITFALAFARKLRRPTATPSSPPSPSPRRAHQHNVPRTTDINTPPSWLEDACCLSAGIRSWSQSSPQRVRTGRPITTKRAS